ncbi:MAG: glycosyltransferase family 4 protein [Flavobacteriales bacterium]|nr:glycosyltransferase family 4 protein [Flavobacteriales bacterium]
MQRRVLFLYTELAPYFMACVARLAKDHEVEVHVVHWEVNPEAPFHFEALPPKVRLHSRKELSNGELMRFAEELDPDAVFASGWVDKGYLRVCRTMRKRDIPTVMCTDTAWRGDQRQLLATVLAPFWLHGTFSHVWSTGQRQTAYGLRLGIPARRIRTGFYAADVDRFAPLAAQFSALKATRIPHRFLCVARYIPTKGQQLLCDAFAELCKEGHAGDWELWCVGTGELFDQVRSSASGSHARIKHWGFKQADELPELMAQAGVFVLPSTYEPWGVVVQEQACAGMPLLLSDAVGAGERFLHESGNGWGFRAGDKSSLKKALRKAIDAGDDSLRAMGTYSARVGNQWGPGDWALVVMDLLGAR